MPSTPEVIGLANALLVTARDVLRAAHVAEEQQRLTAFDVHRIQHQVHAKLLQQADLLLQAQSTALLLAAGASVAQLNEALRDFDQRLDELAAPERLLGAGLALADAATLAVGFAVQPGPATGANALLAFEAAIAVFTRKDE
jgi:hypothetical protein